MKKLIYLTIMLIFLYNVLAQDFEINLISYEPETGNARIQIANTANIDIHDLKMKIDNTAEKNLADTFRAGLSFSTFQPISPGSHEITLTTKEGISFTKKLYFSPSEKQIEQEVEKQKQALEQQKQAKQQLPIKTTTKINYKYIYSILAIIAIVIFYLLYKKFRK